MLARDPWYSTLEACPANARALPCTTHGSLPRELPSIPVSRPAMLAGPATAMIAQPVRSLVATGVSLTRMRG